MQLLALAPRDENSQRAGTKSRAESASTAVESVRRYPEWLLQHRKDACFTINDFLLSKEIGSGKFGRVVKGKERSSGKHLVIKALKKQDILDEGVYRQLQREVETHCRLSHPNIIRMYAYFHDRLHCYIVLELAGGGNLYQRLYTMPKNRLDERTAAQYIRQLASALAYLHRRSVIHRDLKPENVLLHIDADGKETLKLADFGWCVTQRSNSQRTTLCGTPEYLPPELCVADKGEYGSPFDLYCVGVLGYEMLAGKTPFPFEGGDLPRHMERVAQGLAKLRFPAFFSPGAHALIRSLMGSDPSTRPSAVEVLAHPWVVMHAGTTDDSEWDY